MQIDNLRCFEFQVFSLNVGHRFWEQNLIRTDTRLFMALWISVWIGVHFAVENWLYYRVLPQASLGTSWYMVYEYTSKKYVKSWVEKHYWPQSFRWACVAWVLYVSWKWLCQRAIMTALLPGEKWEASTTRGSSDLTRLTCGKKVHVEKAFAGGSRMG